MAKQKLPTLESILGPNPREVNLFINKFNGFWHCWVDTHCIKQDGSPLRRLVCRDRDKAKVQAFVGEIGWSKLEGQLFD